MFCFQDLLPLFRNKVFTTTKPLIYKFVMFGKYPMSFFNFKLTIFDLQVKDTIRSKIEYKSRFFIFSHII